MNGYASVGAFDNKPLPTLGGDGRLPPSFRGDNTSQEYSAPPPPPKVIHEQRPGMAHNGRHHLDPINTSTLGAGDGMFLTVATRSSV